MTGVINISDEKSGQPTFIVAPQVGDVSMKKSRLTKKHLLIGGLSLLITTLLVAGVLIAIRIYTDSNIQALKLHYSMTLKDNDNNKVQQNVSADADANVVQYDVSRDGMKAWILQDFDKGIEVNKVETDAGVACYLTALNRSNAQEPKSIPTSAPTLGSNTPSRQLVYRLSETPVTDISFLGKRAVALCQNVPTHWMVPNCENSVSRDVPVPMNTTSPGQRSKRSPFCSVCGGYRCSCGCCSAVCGEFELSMCVYRYTCNVYQCTYIMRSTSCAFSLSSYPYNNCVYNGVDYSYPWY